MYTLAINQHTQVRVFLPLVHSKYFGSYRFQRIKHFCNNSSPFFDTFKIGTKDVIINNSSEEVQTTHKLVNETFSVPLHYLHNKYALSNVIDESSLGIIVLEIGSTVLGVNANFLVDRLNTITMSRVAVRSQTMLYPLTDFETELTKFSKRQSAFAKYLKNMNKEVYLVEYLNFLFIRIMFPCLRHHSISDKNKLS